MEKVGYKKNNNSEPITEAKFGISTLSVEKDFFNGQFYYWFVLTFDSRRSVRVETTGQPQDVFEEYNGRQLHPDILLYVKYGQLWVHLTVRDLYRVASKAIMRTAERNITLDLSQETSWVLVRIK